MVLTTELVGLVVEGRKDVAAEVTGEVEETLVEETDELELLAEEEMPAVEDTELIGEVEVEEEMAELVGTELASPVLTTEVGTDVGAEEEATAGAREVIVGFGLHGLAAESPISEAITILTRILTNEAGSWFCEMAQQGMTVQGVKRETALNTPEKE